MSIWWDEHKQKYRSNLPFKVLYVWGWPVIRFALQRLDPETATKFTIWVGIPLAGFISKVWEFCKFLLLLPALLLIALLIKTPWFTCTPEENDK